jgi:hypothetical protein
LDWTNWPYWIWRNWPYWIYRSDWYDRIRCIRGDGPYRTHWCNRSSRCDGLDWLDWLDRLYWVHWPRWRFWTAG